MEAEKVDPRSDDKEEHVLEGRDVVKIYNQNSQTNESVKAVEEASFSVSENEFVVVVGPSGCGKTTLLHLCAGLIETTKGVINYRGEPITGPSTNRAVVFQDFNLFPWRTVLENVCFGLEMGDTPKEEYNEKAKKYIDLVNLSGFEENYPKELSGGMKQRVGLARALTVDPDVLLMDEPFGALDAQTREVMQDELLRIWEQDRKTIFFITHDIDEALLLADHIFVMGINPRCFVKEINVPFDRPRYDKNIESHPEYNNLQQEIWDTLKSDINIQ